jgi:hypothetical protein
LREEGENNMCLAYLGLPQAIDVLLLFDLRDEHPIQYLLLQGPQELQSLKDCSLKYY